MGPEEAPEQLVPAAHQQHHRVALDRLLQRVRLGRYQVRCHDLLLAILAAAEEHRVQRGRIDPVAERRRFDLHPDAAPLAAPHQRQDIAAIPVNVHQVGVQVGEGQAQRLGQGPRTPNDVRTDKVESIKSQIEAGTYEDDHKLNVSVDRLLDDLTKDL